jgi:hypothetical protein
LVQEVEGMAVETEPSAAAGEIAVDGGDGARRAEADGGR